MSQNFNPKQIFFNEIQIFHIFNLFNFRFILPLATKESFSVTSALFR